MNRREFLRSSGGGLGSIALAALLSESARAGDRLHHKPKAKRVVQLFMAGGASHVDLFDFKPELVKRHGQAANFGETVEAFQNGLGPWLKPVWEFKPYGKSARQLSETVSPLGAVADVIRWSPNQGLREKFEKDRLGAEFWLPLLLLVLFCGRRRLITTRQIPRDDSLAPMSLPRERRRHRASPA